MRPKKPIRLGLFGGTFNPIHYGHLRAAEEVAELLNLQELWFIPAGLPPHKAPEAVTPFEVRLAMTRLAVGRHPRFRVSDLEGRRPGKSYTVETLRHLRQEFGPEGELFFILGLDSLLEIPTWKDYRELFTLSHFAVLERPGYDPGQVEEVLKGQVHGDFQARGANLFVHPSGHQVVILATTHLDIAASRIRELARQGRSLRYLLPEAVRRFILKNRLYR